MGNSSSSTITNSIQNKVVNKSLIENINENISNIMTNTIVSNNTSAQSGMTQSAVINIGSISSIGQGSDISGLDLLIEQNADLTFNSNDKSIQDNNITVDYALKLVAELSNSISNDQAAKLASDAKATQTNDLLSTAVLNNVKTDVNNQIKNDINNENITRLINQVSNTITQNSETLNFKECILSNLQRGSMTIGEITAQQGGKITNIKLGIKQSMKVIQSCIFDTIQKSDITSKIAQDFGFTVVNDTKNKQTGESEATATTEQKNLGIVATIGALTGPSLYSVIGLVIVAIIGIMVIVLRFSLTGKGLAKEANAFAKHVNPETLNFAQKFIQGQGQDMGLGSRSRSRSRSRSG